MSDGPRVLVLGAYGLIGSFIARHLIEDECRVIGLGRSAPAAAEMDRVAADLRDMTRAGDWAPLTTIQDGLSV